MRFLIDRMPETAEGCLFMTRQFEEREKHRWIPVTERIPDNDRYVLLSFKNYSLPLAGRCETDEEGSAFFIGDETVSCSKMGVFVNAWMELPEPYDQAENKKE